MAGFSFLWKRGKQFKQAHPDEGMDFYYNEEMKRWVKRGEEDLVAQETAAPPPPKRTTPTPTDAVKKTSPAGGLPSRYPALPGVNSAAAPSTPSLLSNRPASRPGSRNASSGLGENPQVQAFVPKIPSPSPDGMDGGIAPQPDTNSPQKASLRRAVDSQPPLIPSSSTSPSDAPFDQLHASPGSPTLPGQHQPLHDQQSATNSEPHSDVLQPRQFNPQPQSTPQCSPEAPLSASFPASPSRCPIDNDATYSHAQRADPANEESFGVASPLLAPVCDPSGGAGEFADSAAAQTESQDGVAGSELAGVPHPDEIPSPWVAYDYSQWGEDLWQRVSAHDIELFYYHYVQFTVQQGWTDTDWESYYAEYPGHQEWVDYYYLKWQSEGGVPMEPLPRIGLPLAGGGVVTEEWLQGAQGAEQCPIEADESHATSDSAAAGMFEMQGGSLHATSGETLTVPASAQTSEMLSGEAIANFSPAPPDGRQGDLCQIQEDMQAVCTSDTGAGLPPVLGADSLIAAEYSPSIHPPTLPLNPPMPLVDTGSEFANSTATAYTESPHTGGEASLQATSPISPYMARPSPVPNPDDADMWPEASVLRAAVAEYAAVMRDDSVAASDDDDRYRAESPDDTVPVSAMPQMTDPLQLPAGGSNVFSDSNTVAAADAPGENEQEYDSTEGTSTGLVRSWIEGNMSPRPRSSPQHRNQPAVPDETPQGLNAQLSVLTAEVEDLRKAIQGYNVEKDHLTATLTEANESKAASEQRATAAGAALAQAHVEKKALQDQVDSLLAQVKHLEEASSRDASTQAENAKLQQQLQDALVRAEEAEAHVNNSTEGTAEEVRALQAEIEELSGDVFEGMCALGIESDRVAALVQALASVGMDANPILEEIENRHLDEAAAQMGGQMA